MRRNESDDLAWTIIHYVLMILAIAGFVVSGAFVISVWVTKLLFRVVNEMTDGEIDRNEAIGLLFSAVMFGALALLLLPYIQVPDMPLEQLIGGLVLAGMVWGVAVGYKVLLDWWHELEMTALPASSFTQTLNLPEQPYMPSGEANP